ncbi:MAG: VOC family protein [Micropruina sp.]
MLTLKPAETVTLSGLEDWRRMLGVLRAHFVCRDFATGLALVNRIGEVAEALNHHPDVDLSSRFVTVSVATHRAKGLTEKDVEFARRVSAAASDLGVPVKAGRLSMLSIAFDTRSEGRIRPFWRAVLAYQDVANGDLIDPRGRAPLVWFQPAEEGRPRRNPIHLDLEVPAEEIGARIEMALAAGGRMVNEEHAPAWWVLADVEGNQVCLSTWQGQD